MKRLGAVAALAGVAFALRLLLALQVRVPSNDGAIYLWASEAFARGDYEAVFSTVFHAGTALVIGPFIKLGLEPTVAAGVAASGAAFLTVFALDGVAKRLDVSVRACLLALALFVCGFQFVRLPADVYSESFAILVATLSVWAAVSRQSVVAGALAGLAFWFRPEAVLVGVLPLFMRRDPLRRALTAATIAIVVLGYLLLQWRFTSVAAGGGTPKLGFMLGLGPLGPLFDGELWLALLALLGNVWRLPRSAVSGLDYVMFFVAIYGLARLWRARPRVARGCTAWLVMHVCVLLAFQVKPRFFMMLAPIVYPLTAFALDRASRRSRYPRVVYGMVVAALCIALVRVGKDYVDVPRRDKKVEIALGIDFRGQLDPGELLTSFPRVAWAADLKPLPPWPWDAASLIERLDWRDVSYVVLPNTVENRRTMALRRAGFRLRETRANRLDIYERF